VRSSASQALLILIASQSDTGPGRYAYWQFVAVALLRMAGGTFAAVDCVYIT
jgi:hypothetical protein